MNTQRISVLLAALFGLLLGQMVQAGDVSLASAPMVSGLSKVVPPNLYFVLDDSGSMDNAYMPDDVDNNRTKVCYRNYGYNKIYYNPAITYTPPVRANGTSYADATFTAAYDDGYNTSGGTTDLSLQTTQTTNVQRTLGSNPIYTTAGSTLVVVTHASHGFATGTSIRFSNGPSSVNRVRINGRTVVITVINSNSYSFIATSFTGSNTAANPTGYGGGTSVEVEFPQTETFNTVYFAKYTTAPTAPPATCAADPAYTKEWPVTAAEKTNFANWYSYYRTRMLNMKTSAGRAFKNIDDKFRVGFSTINNRGITGNSFLKIKPFDTTQKSAWYTAFYDTQPDSTTPLLGALSKAGRLYAGKLLTGNDDPVLYSCQQNFTLLTTDGYWTDPVAAYGPYKENNTTEVGDQDGVAGTARPYYDALAKSNTLADVAQYYYKTDLRPVSGSLGGLTPDNTRVDVSTNNVPSAGSDSASWQHMTTFTLGLGVPGTLVNYNEDYLTGASSDYNAILQGSKNWPDPTCGTNTCDKAKLDDLWHAAVNGRGQYLSASNPDSLISALRKTLAAISRTNGAAATAATSNLEPVVGDNYAFVAQYSTAVWTGDLQARTIDLQTGALSANTSWSAKTQMAGKTSAASDTRTIKMRGSGNTLVDFSSANLSSQKTAGYFKASSSNPKGALSQYVDFSGAQQAAATDDAMIAYIRGQSGSEDNANNTDRLFRERAETVLGDIVNSAPVYVRKPPFTYSDAGYTAYASAQASRQAMVYVGANDGMLHAFNATTGNEAWAFVPTAVLPYLYKLADYTYSNNHRFFVDGPLTVGDAFDSSSNSWRTILVGGLGGGGQAYFALDITDPAAPVLLWEFSSATDSDLGYSYGNPIITKRASDGKWIVAFASGYNNTAGDSKGRLYVVDALTGTKLSEIITDNSVTNPDVSGIARINNFVSNTMTDNTTQYVYGGDLGGALWRFDLTAASAQKLGSTSATTGNQPITVRPEIGYVRDGGGTYHRVIYFATGRYLGFNDLSSNVPSATVAQAVYAVADTGSNLGVLTASAAKLVSQTITAATRSIDNPLPVDLASKNGWYVNLPVGQRVSVDLKLQVGTLVVVANIPQDDYCVVGGSSVLYEFAYKTGAAISTIPAKTVGFPIGSSIGTGLTLIKLPNNKVVAIVTQADTSVPVLSLATEAGSGLNLRRVSWRELN